MIDPAELTFLLERAVDARKELLVLDHVGDRYRGACRLFNGYLEGCPELVVDLYGRTLLFHCYDEQAHSYSPLITTAKNSLLALLPWAQTVVLKARKSANPDAQRGRIIHGELLDDRVREHGIWYAIDLLMNQDTSLYLDTRNLRRWLLDNMGDKSVLNTFAYTGSLGVAAQADGAKRVVQTDLNRRFLNVAKRSYTLNGFPIAKKLFQTADFWPQMNRLKKIGERFDCVILDPPFFSQTQAGTVDLARDSVRLINKVRPLVNDGGQIVAVNNALYLSGAEYMRALEALCIDGHVEIQELIPAPNDFTGYEQTVSAPPITDPSPFNHATKIAVLGIKHKAIPQNKIPTGARS